MNTVVFTQRVEVVESYNERRDCADQRISAFLASCGYVPIALPNDAALALRIVETVKPSGIVLIGGNSLVKYGGNAPERDETDKALIACAVSKKIPLYGFCRGMQSVLDYFGESLVNVQGHVAVRHRLVGECWIGREVNSYHNQACLQVRSSELETLAATDDGVVESVRHRTLPIAATMWHPERETPFSADDIQFVHNLFK